MKHRPKVAAAIGVALVALALPACSAAQPGQAAVVGTTDIGESVIADQMRSLNELTGEPADTPSAQRATTIVSYNIGYELIHQTAADLEVSVPQARLDQIYDQQVQSLGGEDRLLEAAAQQGVAPTVIRRDLESQLLAGAIAERLAPGADQQTQQQALLSAVSQLAGRIGVVVAPKYGVWNPEQLQIVPDPDAVSRPEVPPASAIPVP